MPGENDLLLGKACLDLKSGCEPQENARSDNLHYTEFGPLRHGFFLRLILCLKLTSQPFLEKRINFLINRRAMKQIIPEKVTPAALAAIIPVSLPTIYRWERKGRLPPRHEVSPGSCAWSRDEILPLLDELRQFSPLAQRARTAFAKPPAVLGA